MANFPAPTIENQLCLVVQPFTHSAFSHAMEITYAVDNPTARSTQNVADRCQANFNASFPVANFSDALTIEPPFVIQGDGGTVPSQAVAAGAAVIGTDTGAMPSPQVTTLYKKITALGGRRNRGRFYMPYQTYEGYVAATGLIDSGHRAALQGFADDFLAALVADTLPMVIANKTLVTSGSPPKPHVTEIFTGAEVTTLFVESHVATQRRRLERS